MLGTTVFHGIGDGFLPNAKEINLHRARETHRVALDFKVHLGLFVRDQWLHDLLQCRNEISIFEQLAAQIPHGASGFDHAVTAHVASRLQRVLRDSWRLLKTINREIELHGDSSEFLL